MKVNKLKNEDGYSCFYAFVQLPGHSSKTIYRSNQTYDNIPPTLTVIQERTFSVMYDHCVFYGWKSPHQMLSHPLSALSA